jgi:quercetin dioxygenase-like cupin family protein
MRLRLALLCALAFVAAPPVAWPQSETVLATGQLASVVALPVYFRLYRAHLPAGQRSTYRGSSAMLYEISGAATLDFGEGRTQSLAEGAAVFVEPGQGVKITASPAAPSELLLFLLSALPNQKPPLDKPATTKELFRTGDSLPGLAPGPYAFALTRLTFPAAMPATQATSPATGAALDYVLAGSAALTADGKTEKLAAEAVLVESAGWVHSWANPGGEPLVVLRAGITAAK